MEDIYEEIVRIKNKGDICALASIVWVKGSTPRPEGSKMLVRSDGTILGSIGGRVCGSQRLGSRDAGNQARISQSLGF